MDALNSAIEMVENHHLSEIKVIQDDGAILAWKTIAKLKSRYHVARKSAEYDQISFLAQIRQFLMDFQLKIGYTSSTTSILEVGYLQGTPDTLEEVGCQNIDI